MSKKEQNDVDDPSKSCSVGNANGSNCKNNAESIEPLNFINLETLKNKIFNKNGEVNDSLFVIIDCRSYFAYDNGHIKGSVYIATSLSEVIKERLKDGMPFYDTFNCMTTKQKIVRHLKEKSEKKADIILYDQNSNRLTKLDDANDLKYFYNTIINRYSDRFNCYILEGGYLTFTNKYKKFTPQFLDIEKTNNENGFVEIHVSRCRDRTDQQEYISQILNAKFTKIEPYLYLGNEQDVIQRFEDLKAEGIGYILNLNDTENYKSETLGVQYKWIPIKDNDRAKISAHFNDAIEFIQFVSEKAKNNNSKVLVHCQAGVSRSPTIIIAYLMKENNWNFQRASDYVKGKRNIIDVNVGFYFQLLKYESELNELNKNTTEH